MYFIVRGHSPTVYVVTPLVKPAYVERWRFVLRNPSVAGVAVVCLLLYREHCLYAIFVECYKCLRDDNPLLLVGIPGILAAIYSRLAVVY